MAFDEYSEYQLLENEQSDIENLTDLSNSKLTSKYITVDDRNSFFQFSTDLSAINVMHINCRSLKENLGHSMNCSILFPVHYLPLL